uniref:Uncharacterized protein n=1 Tax=Entomoneis paludosa TaxID=265537 RepID=A0A7S2Y3F4_9STRA|mmetsp:Transcript_13328/g.27625  ORF Transcript_13328/g.27625 Transcript_13328/m.27625 type:complete len:344 (+) Transcript_13328:151-1182(+)
MCRNKPYTKPCHLLFLGLTVTCLFHSVDSFLPLKNYHHHTPATFGLEKPSVTLFEQQKNDNDGGGNPLKALFNPYESKIPKEIEREIYEAEGNTAAAQDRTTRVGFYTLLAVLGVGMAFFNFFISQLRVSETPDGSLFDLADSSFAWVDGNFLTQFFFMNKIGGGLCLLFGAGAGLLAEAELDTRRINAEKIYDELVRRREKKEQKAAAAPSKKKKKKRKSTKESKRLNALVEVMEESDASTTPEPVQAEAEVAPKNSSAELETTESTDASGDTKDEGLFEKVKGFYERADTMAASQALLLNKKLEDAGVLDKITDETGLKVVGKEQAAAAAAKEESSKPTEK